MSGKKRKNTTSKKLNQTSTDSTSNDALTNDGQEIINDDVSTSADQSAADSLADNQVSDPVPSDQALIEANEEPAAEHNLDDIDNTGDVESTLSSGEGSEQDTLLNTADSGAIIEELAPELVVDEVDVSQADDVAAVADANPEPPPSEVVSTLTAEQSPPGDTKSSGVAKKLGLLLILLLILAVALGGYFAWQYFQSDKDGQSQAIAAISELDAKISDRLAAQQKTIEALSAQALTRNSSVDDMRLLVEQTTGEQDWIKQRLENHTNRLRSLAGTSREDWILAEARYLLRLANQRLLTERGTKSAQALLQTVDKMLLDLDDADLYSVRQAIQNDLAALKLAPNVDREGIYLRIGALAKQIRTIPSAPISEKQFAGKALSEVPNQSSTASEEIATSQAEETSSWYSPITGSLAKAWSAVANSVEVRHYDSPPALFITEQEEASVRHNLHLLLTQAQLSLLREEPEIYKSSLTNAVEWINQYFGHYDKKSVLIGELNSLQAMPVAEQSPDISGSLKVLTDYIERYHKLTPEKNPVDEAEANNSTEENAREEVSP